MNGKTTDLVYSSSPSISFIFFSAFLSFLDLGSWGMTSSLWCLAFRAFFLACCEGRTGRKEGNWRESCIG
jgi:hypothetical protein